MKKDVAAPSIVLIPNREGYLIYKRDSAVVFFSINSSSESTLDFH